MNYEELIEITVEVEQLSTAMEICDTKLNLCNDILALESISDVPPSMLRTLESTFAPFTLDTAVSTESIVSKIKDLAVYIAKAIATMFSKLYGYVKKFFKWITGNTKDTEKKLDKAIDDLDKAKKNDDKPVDEAEVAEVVDADTDVKAAKEKTKAAVDASEAIVDLVKDVVEEEKPSPEEVARQVAEMKLEGNKVLDVAWRENVVDKGRVGKELSSKKAGTKDDPLTEKVFEALQSEGSPTGMNWVCLFSDDLCISYKAVAALNYKKTEKKKPSGAATAWARAKAAKELNDQIKRDAADRNKIYSMVEDNIAEAMDNINVEISKTDDGEKLATLRILLNELHATASSLKDCAMYEMGAFKKGTDAIRRTLVTISAAILEADIYVDTKNIGLIYLSDQGRKSLEEGLYINDSRRIMLLKDYIAFTIPVSSRIEKSMGINADKLITSTNIQPYPKIGEKISYFHYTEEMDKVRKTLKVIVSLGKGHTDEELDVLLDTYNKIKKDYVDSEPKK